MNSTYKLHVIKFMACPSNEVCGIWGKATGDLNLTPSINIGKKSK
jgi:hypothetical protein